MYMAEKPTQDEMASIEEIVGYKPETYLSDEEIEIIRTVFAGRQGAILMHILRKVLMPTVLDPDLPIEEMGKDMWLNQIDFKTLSADEAKAISMGLQMTTKAIFGSLIQLKQLALVKEESPEDRAARRRKNSAR